jgi:hypothetical protein
MASSPLMLSNFVAGLRAKPLEKGASVGIEVIDRELPEGFPRGVVEICAPSGLGRATQLSLSFLAQAQRRDAQTLRQRDERAWVAWVDPGATLYAPGVVQAGVDLERLLVVRPDGADVARTAVKLAQSRLFAALVIDRGASSGARDRWHTVVRRLALAAETSDMTILLLSSTAQAHRELLPTAMRIELSRQSRDRLRLAVTKDRRGRLPSPFSVPLRELRCA